MFDRFQFSFTQQKEFVTNASHELRTPLAILYLSMKENLQYKELPESLQQNLFDHCNALLRLSRLVDNLLNLSVLEMNGLNATEEINLNSLADEVIGEFQPLVQDRKIELKTIYEGQCTLAGNKEKMRQVFINLLDNGVKYNVDGGGDPDSVTT